MDSRAHIPTAYGRSAQVPGMMRHGRFSSSNWPGDSLTSPELETNFAVQEAEIEQLTGDNHRLAANHVALRQDLVSAQEEIERLRAHMRSIQTESDIQVRILLEKIAKMEKDTRAGESAKKELQQAHIEAQGLERAKKELTAQIQQATMDLDKARSDIKGIREMHNELDGLRQDHQRLRTTFQYEKGLNMEKVEQMHVMERDMVGMAREVEKLREEVLNAQAVAHGPNPFVGSYMNSDPFYPPAPMRASGGYAYPFGRLHAHMGAGAGEGMIPYGSGNSTDAPVGIVSAASPSGVGSGSGGSYDTSHVRK